MTIYWRESLEDARLTQLRAIFLKATPASICAPREHDFCGTATRIAGSLDEGKNRQIRRLLEAVSVRVLRLVRVSIGPLELGDLKKGSVRRLTAEEKEEIDRALRVVA
jgi:pseudouridine synthase